MSRKSLDAFGKVFIQNCRTDVLREWRDVFSGHIKAPEDVALRKRLESKLSKEQMSLVLDQLVPEVVGSVLHHVLWMVEQEERIGLSWNEDDEHLDLREASDGLSGELYSDEGWIARFGGASE